MPPIVARTRGIARAINTIIEGGRRRISASGNRLFSKRKSALASVARVLRRARRIVAPIAVSVWRKEAKYLAQGAGCEVRWVFSVLAGCGAELKVDSAGLVA